MKRFCNSWVLVAASVLLCLVVLQLGCGPSKPAATPAETKFADLQKTLDLVNYDKALTLSADIIKQYGDSESADRARVLRTILLAGYADGYRAIAEAYLRGVENTKKSSGAMRATAFDYYRRQRSTAFQLFEAANFCLKTHADGKTYVIASKYPSKDAGTNRYLETVGSGALISPEELKAAETDELQNGVIRMLVKFSGAGDRSGARKALESGNLPIEASLYYAVLSRILLDNQKIFDKTVLNERERYQLFFQKAVECYNLTDKLLKAKPDKDVQFLANEIKTDVDALQKKGLKAS